MLKKKGHASRMPLYEDFNLRLFLAKHREYPFQIFVTWPGAVFADLERFRIFHFRSALAIPFLEGFFYIRCNPSGTVACKPFFSLIFILWHLIQISADPR